MTSPIYAGGTATATGEVTDTAVDGERGLVHLDVVVRSERGTCVTAEVTIELPHEEEI
jgi:acyl dehydratase